MGERAPHRALEHSRTALRGSCEHSAARRDPYRPLRRHRDTARRLARRIFLARPVGRRSTMARGRPACRRLHRCTRDRARRQQLLHHPGIPVSDSNLRRPLGGRSGDWRLRRTAAGTAARAGPRRCAPDKHRNRLFDLECKLLCVIGLLRSDAGRRFRASREPVLPTVHDGARGLRRSRDRLPAITTRTRTRVSRLGRDEAIKDPSGSAIGDSETPLMKTLLLGGVRSGKSRYAEALARVHGGPVTVIATATTDDEEMRARIAAHRARRPAEWTVVEEPICLADALRAAASPSGIVVIECLTLWLTNLLLSPRSADLERQR